MPSFIEFQNWGWNVATLGFIGTMFFTLVQGAGVVKQTWAIWLRRSAESVTLPIVMFMTISQIAFTGYGWMQSSLGIILNGFLFVPFGLEAATIIRFKGIDQLSKKVFLGSLVFIPILLLAPRWCIDWVVAAGMSVSCILISQQIQEIWRSPNRGSLDITMLLCMAGSSTFWTIFGWAINNLVIGVFSPIFLLEWITIMAIWYCKPPAPIEATQET